MSSGVFFNLYQGKNQVEISEINTTFQISCNIDSPHDVNAEHNRLINAGATSVIPPKYEEYGMRICFVADPKEIKFRYAYHYTSHLVKTI